MTESDFLNFSYLRTGSPDQQKAYRALEESNLFTTLKEFNPVLTGTMPLDIFIEGSDLDIGCEVYDQEGFEKILILNFQHHTNFSIHKKVLNQVPSIIGSFFSDEFIFEIVGQPVPVNQQLAFRHMIVEHEILLARGDSFKKEIINLKKKGLKTEPAFAQLLGLKGDPYQVVLRYGNAHD